MSSSVTSSDMMMIATCDWTLSDVSSVVSLSVYQAPNLGVMVYQLRQCAAQFTTVFESHRQFEQKLAAIHELSTEDLKQVSDRRSLPMFL